MGQHGRGENVDEIFRCLGDKTVEVFALVKECLGVNGGVGAVGRSGGHECSRGVNIVVIVGGEEAGVFGL